MEPKNSLMAKLLATNRAKVDLRLIEAWSTEKWGKRLTDIYMHKLLKELKSIAINPEQGNLRKHRSEPFLMAPIEHHFAIYKKIEDGIIVVTILHSNRDIEGYIEKLNETLNQEALNHQEQPINTKIYEKVE